MGVEPPSHSLRKKTCERRENRKEVLVILGAYLGFSGIVSVLVQSQARQEQFFHNWQGIRSILGVCMNLAASLSLTDLAGPDREGVNQ